MNAELREAVERALVRMEHDDPQGVSYVRQELEMLRAPFAIEDATAGSHWFGEWVGEKRRREKADALLRECLTVMELHPATHASITAHQGGENNG
jgi:hypothetical protein